MYQQEAGVRFLYQSEDEYSFVDNYGETVHLYYITVARYVYHLHHQVQAALSVNFQ